MMRIVVMMLLGEASSSLCNHLRRAGSGLSVVCTSISGENRAWADLSVFGATKIGDLA
ncbi:hypothetical protein D3C80_1958010 [compost metagenome]